MTTVKNYSKINGKYMIQTTGERDGLALDDGEGEFLYGIVRALKPKVLLEIGTHKGFSTGYLVEAIKDNGVGHLWTTDPFDYGASQSVTFEDRQFVDYLNKRGDEVKVPALIDFVFLDGLHHITDVVPEIKNVLPQLSKDAVIVFHDAQNEESNIKEGVNAAIKKMKLKTIWLPTKFGLQVYQNNDLLK